MFNYSSTDALADFGWKWNHIQPIKGNTPVHKLKEKHLIFSEFIAAGITIPNQLTFLHVKIAMGFEHSVVSLECMQCYDGNPVIMHVGLYPSRENYCPWFTNADECGDGKDISWIDHHEYQLSLQNSSLYDFSAAENITIAISDQDASRVFDHLGEVSSQCLPQYSYNKVSNNCIDFAQAIYSMVGMNGHYMDQLYEEQTMMQSLMANQYMRSWLSFLEPVHYFLE